MQPKFYLLGQSDCQNPTAISKAQILQWQESGFITYLGVAKDVRPFIESSSCIVLPSSYKEGVPRVLLEAMSMGKAIITTNIAGCKECVAPPFRAYQNLLIGQNGILIPPKDTTALSLAISILNPSLLTQMGANAREFVKSRFCISNTIKHYTKAIKAITSESTTSTQPLTQTIPLAFVSNTCFGMYNFRLKVLQSLQKSGFEIHIIAPFDTTTQALQNEGFFLHDLSLHSRSLNPFKDLATLLNLYKILKKIKPHLVFNYTIKPAIYSSWLCNFLKIPNIAIITGLGYVFINDKGDTMSFKKSLLRSVVCNMYRFCLKKTKEVWFLNHDDKEEFLSHRLICEKQAFLLDSEGVDIEHFSPQKTMSIDSEVSFLLIARMLWDKGVGEFVEAAKMVQETIRADSNGGGGKLKISFYLLGASDCDNPAAISKAQILQWQESGFITYLGVAKDVRAFIESSSCIVLPSYREGVSVSLLEAMSMSKPIITSNATGCKHLVKISHNGFLCQVRDAKSLAKAMQDFIHLSPQQRVKMGENAREFVCKNYRIERIIAIYQKACQKYGKYSTTPPVQ